MLSIIVGAVSLITCTCQVHVKNVGSLDGGGILTNIILSTIPQRSSSILLVKEKGKDAYDDIIMDIQKGKATSGFQVTEMMSEDLTINETREHIVQKYQLTRNFRRTSWNVVFVVMSENVEFLKTFAQRSLKHRLLVWATKVIVITSLSPDIMDSLLTNYWSFSMMNTMFVNKQDKENGSWEIYSHLPYSPPGQQIVRLADWKVETELNYTSSSSLFPEKFTDFHGATVNVTSMIFKPIWFPVKEAAPNGSIVEKMTGMDYILLETVAQKLNFSFYVVPIKSWKEGFDMVARREAFMTPVNCAILDTRLERYDFTIGYTYVRISFAMAKPRITPNWSSLYDPLNPGVWLSILIATLLMPVVYYSILKVEQPNDPACQKGFGWTSFVIIGVLLGQPQSGRLPTHDASRLAAVVWFIFVFVMSTGYQGKLTASLTLPRYPQRPETIEQLVNQAERVTMASWGSDYKRSFKNSGSSVMEKLADLMHLGPELKEGFYEALTKKQAQLDTLVALLVGMAEHFTFKDGSPRFYIGKETILPGIAAWPIPHDAPFTDNLNWHLEACIEAGLYDKWTEDMLTMTRHATWRRKRAYRDLQRKQGNLADEEILDEDDEDDRKPLSLRHMQGALALYGFGMALSGLVFAAEAVVGKCSNKGRIS